MKRKQKVPRRTRRQTSLKPADNADNIVSHSYAKGNRCNTEENLKIQKSNFKDTREKGKSFPCDMPNEFKDRNIVDLEENFYTKNGSLNRLKTIEKTQRATEISSDNCTGISAQHLKQLDHPSENSNVLNRNLKRPLDNGALSGDVLKTPTAFVNFKNESEDGNMPVILNVFTLSQIPTSHIKQKTTNRILENNFPVTPPCSPPLLKHEQFTGTQNSTSRSKIKTAFSSLHGLTKPTFNKSTMESKVYNIYRPVRHAVLPAFPGANSQINCTVEDETTRCYDANNSNNIQLPETNVKNYLIPFSMKLAPTKSFVLQENKPFPESSSREGNDVSEANKHHDQCIFSELLQDIERKHFSRNETPNTTNQEQRNIENSRLGCLSTSRNNAVRCGHLEPSGEHKIENVHNLEFSPMMPNDGNKNNVKDNHIILSPCDIKVLQLKKRLQEQEAALKKLRKNH